MAIAAFKASYADFKLIKGRKCAQIILEVPIEAADAALQALGGVPQPHQETWLGVARLSLESGEAATQLTVNQPTAGSNPASPAKERRSFSSLPLSQQVGIRCNEPAFWQFINESCEVIKGIESAEGAASFIRGYCKVQSRSEITHGSLAGNDWMNFSDKYEAWLRRPTF